MKENKINKLPLDFSQLMDLLKQVRSREIEFEEFWAECTRSAVILDEHDIALLKAELEKLAIEKKKVINR